MSSIPVTLNPAGTPAIEVAASPAETVLSEAEARAAIAQEALLDGATEDELDYLENCLRPANKAGVALWALYSTLVLTSAAVAIAAWRLVHG